MKKGQLGKKWSIEARKKHSLVMKGKSTSPSTQFKKGHKFLGDLTKPNYFQKGITHSLQWRIKMSKIMAGNNNPAWRGGKTPKLFALRLTFKYREWRKSVLLRDNFTCVFCGYKSKGIKPSDIQADHIKPFAIYPKLRFTISNGRTLCKPCHKITDTYGYKKSDYLIGQLQLAT